MATLLPVAEQQFLDGDGAPLVGGLVYLYTPNTSQLKDSWSDPAQTTPNTNPVILDAAGRGTIYGVGSYRMVLKDADGNLIFDAVTADTASSGASWSGVSTGTGTNIVLTAPNFASVDGQAIDFILGVSLTGPAQATVNNVAIPLKIDTQAGPVQTSAGSAIAGNRYRLTYDAKAGLLHLSAGIDKSYVDSADAATLAAAQAYAVQQANAVLSTAESYAASVAAAAQAAAIAAASVDASGKASAAQTAAYNGAVAYAAAGDSSTLSQAETYASNADASVLASAQGYAYGQAQAAQSFATNADATVTANANSYAAGQASSALASARSYSDGQLASAQSSNASTYVRGVRLSGVAYPGLPYSRSNGQVVTYVNFSPNSIGVGNIQYNIGGTWVSIADA